MTLPRIKPSYLVALLLALAAIGWILSGQFAGREPVAAPNGVGSAADEAPPPQVRVRILSAEPRTTEIVLRGRTEASRAVLLRAETRGSVAEILVEKGRPVAAGEPLLRLAENDRRARLRQAEALLAQRRIEYEAASRLAERGHRAETAVAEARAQLEEARAAVAAIELDIAHTAVRAPFDGLLEERPVELGDFVDVGDAVARIIDLDPVLVVGQVSERDVGRLQEGALGRARLVTGQEVEGIVRYVAAVADEATRTFRLELEVANPDLEIVQGVSAEIRLPVASLLAHRVSPAVLTLDDAGLLGVKTVNAAGIVEFVPVRIAADEADGVWIVGLPETVTLITVGQEFVIAGQRVRPVPETARSAS